MDLAELAKHLRQEYIFVSSEKEEIQRLTEEAVRSSEQLCHISWISRQQKTLLEQLIRASSTVSPETCYSQLNSLEQINFLQGYTHLSYHESKIGEFLRNLCENPKLLAYCLTKCSTELVTKLGSHIMNSIYGNAILPEDEQGFLYLLKHLIHLQILPSNNPRQLLRKGSCAFSILFKLYTESLFSAKLFLTAALHKPIMQLLMEDEWFYDIDPVRALHRFPPAEKLRKFGQPESASYTLKVNEYREHIITKLFSIADRFISSLRNCMYCFPPALAWVISEMYHSVIKTGHVDAVEVRSMCADLVLSFYVCLAICDPELYGITSDAPLSYIARHNLMQVAQILQVLSVSQLEDIDPKVRDLYGKFEKNCMAFLLDTILEKPAADTPPKTVAPFSEFARSSVLITHRDLIELISIVRQVVAADDDASAEKLELHRMVEHLPTIPALQAPQPAVTSSSPAAKATLLNVLSLPSSPDTPNTRKKSTKGKEKRNVLGADQTSDVAVTADNTQPQTFADDVLVISLGVTAEPPGMLSEQKVLEQESKQKKANKSNSVLPGEDYPISESDVQVHEKRTRFSLSHDQDSIATSDNLEGISEGASSRSVASDIENENDADNLSDMMSANVSERGTPNISGRETPTSQPGSQMDGQEDRSAPELPELVRKTHREDVTEKFGKFDLRQELEYYGAKSTVSDSWSTDVLASDSEPPEQNQLERLEEVAEEMVRQNLLAVKLQEVYEVSETASDAWSTDVVASDTSERPVDRLSEFEQTDEVTPSTPTASLDPSNDPGSASAAEDVQEEPFEFKAFNEQLEKLSQGKVHAAYDDAAGGNDERDLTLKASKPRPGFVGSGVGSSSFLEDGGTLKTTYNDGQVAAALELFDPLHVSNSSSSLEVRRSASQQAIVSGNEASGFMRLNSDQSIKSGSDLLVNTGDLLQDNTSLLRNSQQKNLRSRRARGVAEGDGVIDSSGSSQWLSSEVSGSNESLDDSIRLLEQQNVKIDTKRFSTVTAMDYFDVLSDDSKETRSPTEKRPPTEGATALPRISLKLNSVELDLMGAASEPSASRVWSLQRGPQMSRVAEAGRSVLHSDSLGSLDGGEERDSWNESADGARLENRAERIVSGASVTSDGRPRSHRRDDVDESDDRLSPQKKKSGTTAVGFLQSVKERLSRGGKRVKTSSRQQEKEEQHRSLSADGGDKGRVSVFVDRGVHVADTCDHSHVTESSDDILAKYRKPAVKANSQEGGAGGEPIVSFSVSKVKDDDKAETPAYDPANLETCLAFQDTKKKLRRVLSHADPSLLNWPGRVGGQHADRRDGELLAFLQLQLAEAINLKDRDFVAQLHEAIRCLRQFDAHEVRRLVRALKEEYKSRSVYVSYLVRCRQGLLGMRAHLEKLRQRVERDKVLCTKHFLSVYARLFLEKKERSVTRFVADFQKLSVSDEKTDLVERYLADLYQLLERDAMWQYATQQQLDEAKLYIERVLMGHIYTHALYPNGDGDQMRDLILYEHLHKLSQVVTPDHKDLRIPKVYRYECPWPAAQADIALINAYKTPQDKLHCVLRCAATIMNLLSLASERSVPAADDFMPVLLYVIIKANPPGLLSTIQYVTSFYAKRMRDEEQYWWMQFTSAIEFLKTMDYAS